MVTTRYSSGNVTLLLIGTLVAFADGWVSMMTMAFGADPVRNLKSGAVMVVLWASLVLVPASLVVTLRWPKPGAIISWSVVALSCLCIWGSPVILLFLILAAIEGLIAANIASRSEGVVPITVVPK